MSRPVDWTPLAAGDPVPGDPVRVERAGRDYRLVAQAIELAAARLRAIAGNVDMQSDAVAEIRQKADDLSGRIAKAQHRYEATATALLGYAPILTEAQRKSLQALYQAVDAVQDQTVANRLAAEAQYRIDTTPPGADPSTHLIDLANARRRESAAAERLAGAQTMVDQAVRDRDEAAEAARRIIDAAKSQDHLNDSRWDNIKAAVVSTLTSIAEVVDAIAIGAGVLALVFAAVPFVGEFFAAVALIASITSLALRLTLKAFGEGEWLDIGLAAIAVATFGVGKVAVGASEFATTGARAYASLAAGRVAAEAPAVRAAAGLPSFGSSARTIEALVGEGNVMSRNAARSAVSKVTVRGARGAHALETLRGIPGKVGEDLANIRRFDVRHPIAQIRAETPMHPLSFMGERGAASTAGAIDKLHVAMRAEPLVAGQVRAQQVASGAFVATWFGSNAFLGRDTADLLSHEPVPAETLHLTDTDSASTGGRR